MPAPVVRTTKHGGHCALILWCPGCTCGHMIPVEGPQAWHWNGSLTSPTLSPSIKVVWDAGEVGQPSPQVCHSYVREGRWEYLSDCTHKLAGKVVAVVAITEDSL